MLGLLVILPINLVLRAIVDPGANYLYMFGGEGAGILEAFPALVPVPVLYEVPILVVTTPVLLGQWGLYRAYLAASAVLAGWRRPTPAESVPAESVPAGLVPAEPPLSA